MPSSNLQTLVNEVVERIKTNPAALLQALMGQDKKVLVLYRVAKQMFDVDGIIKKELDKFTAKTPEQWLEFEDLILGVIDGDEESMNTVREFILGVVKM